METITAKIKKVVFSNDSDWCLLKLSNGKMVNGVISEQMRNSKDKLIFEGYWKTHPKYGKQFKFESVRSEHDQDPLELIGLPELKMLLSPYTSFTDTELLEAITKAGGVPVVVGKISAHNENQGKAPNSSKFSMSVESPLFMTLGITTLWDIEKVLESWRELRGGLQNLGLLRTHGIMGYMAKLISLHKFKRGELEKILDTDYYQLIQVKGIGFKKIDEIALKADGYNLGDIRRIKAIMVHVLENEMNMTGHTFMTEKNFRYKVNKTSGQNVTDATFDVCSEDLLDAGVIHSIEEQERVALMSTFVSEKNVSIMLHALRRNEDA